MMYGTFFFFLQNRNNPYGIQYFTDTIQDLDEWMEIPL